MSFGQDVTIGSVLTRDISRVRRGLETLSPMGDTSLVDAAYTAMLVGETQAGRALVLLFTDGIDASSYLDPNAVLEIARRSDAVVYAIVTWGSPEPRFLRDLTKTSGGDLFEIESTRDLTAAFTRVFDEFRQRYLVSYSPRGVESGGWHRLQVRVKRPGASVRARPGYRRD